MSTSLSASLKSLYGKLLASKSGRLNKEKARRQRKTLQLERLENRNLMAADLKGTVYNDINTNGVPDATDPGLEGWTVWVDTNGNGSFNTGEPTAVTDTKGKYLIGGLPVGTFNVYEQVEPGFAPTPGSSNRKTVEFRDRKTSKADFGNVSVEITPGRVTGTVFVDSNLNNVKESGEEGLLGWTVFVDTNDDGLLTDGEPIGFTDSDGDYVIDDVVPGSHKVYEELQGGYGPVGSGLFPLQSASRFRQVTVVAGGSVRAEFANTLSQVGTIQGTVWNDTNGDGIRQSTESPFANHPAFIDLDSNGMQDASEPVRLTDSSGFYTFQDIRIGSYLVTESPISGYSSAYGYSNTRSVSVSARSLNTIDFFNLQPKPGTVSGKIFNDVNSDGKITLPEPGLQDWTVYIDSNNNAVPDPSELSAVTDIQGNYAIPNVPYGLATVRIQPHANYSSTTPNSISILVLSEIGRGDINFGQHDLSSFSISGTVFHDANEDLLRGADETGISGITVFIDSNFNNALDAGEVSVISSVDQFYTPNVNELGTYSFSHLARGTYHIVELLPATLSGTPESTRSKTVVIGDVSLDSVDFANQYRDNEIHGTVFDDTNHNHSWDDGEYARPSVTVYIDANRNNHMDDDEPKTITGDDGSYSFTGLKPGAYVVREDDSSTSGPHTYPQTVDGILWPSGSNNPAIGNVSPGLIELSLQNGQSVSQTVSITLPNTGTITNLVDVFLLFDDTGSFTSNSPIVRSAFPTIISSLQASLPGIDLGFGLGRFEEYGNFAAENSTGRPFILNQPIVESITPGFTTAIQSALDRVAPGYGGDTPETDIEALYQLVTGLGFDGNNNGSVQDSGPAGLASTQLNPGISGDVPSFTSYQADLANGGLPSAGNVGGGGFRAGALPIILLATDTGFVFQPKGETEISGTGGVTLPLSQLSQTSRGTTPFGAGAGLQETVTALNALGALVVGLGTNPETSIDPRQSLEALSTLTGAMNRSTATIPNGTTTPIAPGSPLYFQIGAGFGNTVADGIVQAIQNAVTNVDLDLTIKSSDPRVKIINHTGVLNGIGAGESASFDIEFVGDGKPHRFDLQFVRNGTDVVVGSIPVVLGTPVSGDGYSYDDLEDGEIHHSSHFGNYVANVAPGFAGGGNVATVEDSGIVSVLNWATSITAGPSREAGQKVEFKLSTSKPELFESLPAISSQGNLTFTPAANVFGTAEVIVLLNDNGGIGPGGADTSSPYTFTISIDSVNDAPIAIGDSFEATAGTSLQIAGTGVLTNDTDIDGDSLTAILQSPPQHGTLSLNLDGSFTYTPNPGFGGNDSFTYVANDGEDVSIVTAVAIKVTGLNSAPIALGDTFSTNEDMSLTISLSDLVSNDSDPDGDSLSIESVTSPLHGTLTLNSDGSYTYAPEQNFYGVDSFEYRVFDGALYSQNAIVVINIVAVNDAPTAFGENYTTSEDARLIVAAPGLLQNDSDVDGDSLNPVVVTNPLNGTVTISTTGGIDYLPAADFNGIDTFTYKINDGKTDSNIVTVVIQVAAVNDAPAAQNDSYSVNQDSQLTISAPGVMNNDFDIDGDSITPSVTTTPANGSLTFQADGSFVYTPIAGYSGSDSFTYRITDGIASQLATVQITVIPILPPAKFFISDFNVGTTFVYGENGPLVSSYALNRASNKPRGIASNSTGTIQWVIDPKGAVAVHNQNGALLGSWTEIGRAHV